MIKSPTIDDIIAHVIPWVEARYRDDEYVSVALDAAWHAIRTIKNEDNILGYVMRSVYRACRAHRVGNMPSLTLDVAQVASMALDLEDCGLNTQEKLIVTQKIQHDMSYEEIGGMLGMTYVQVRYIYYRALNKLRAHYGVNPLANPDSSS